jgi:hypothetical protein
MAAARNARTTSGEYVAARRALSSLTTINVLAILTIGFTAALSALASERKISSIIAFLRRCTEMAKEGLAGKV